MKRIPFPASFLALGVSLALAGCQSGGPLGGLESGSGRTVAQRPDGQSAGDVGTVRESELRAYCPPVALREGTAYFRTYQGGDRSDPEKIVYQASISDVTRTCRRGQDAFSMTVAVAGRVVPGPAGTTGTLTMPIRIAALRGEEVVFSRLYSHQVTIDDTSGATQFIFKAQDVAIPGVADRGVQVFVGYDEGPNGGGS